MYVCVFLFFRKKINFAWNCLFLIIIKFVADFFKICKIIKNKRHYNGSKYIRRVWVIADEAALPTLFRLLIDDAWTCFLRTVRSDVSEGGGVVSICLGSFMPAYVCENMNGFVLWPLFFFWVTKRLSVLFYMPRSYVGRYVFMNARQSCIA